MPSFVWSCSLGPGVTSLALANPQVAVHSPVEIPQMQQRTRCLLGEELLVNVKPATISTSDDLRYYTPLQRRCFFPEERQLRYFRVSR